MIKRIAVITAILFGTLVVFVSQSEAAQSSKVILVTGFEPFGGDVTNGSWEAVRDLQGKHIDGYEIMAAQLPVLWNEAAAKLQELVRLTHPQAIISFGQAGEEPVRLESTAHNLRENIADNRGLMPPSLTIDTVSPPTQVSSLPLPEIESHLNAAGIPVRVSQDAGTYLCNDTFYVLMSNPGSSEARQIPRGFIHVPPLDANVTTHQGRIIRFDKNLLQKTAEIIIGATIEKLDNRTP